MYRIFGREKARADRKSVVSVPHFTIQSRPRTAFLLYNFKHYPYVNHAFKDNLKGNFGGN